MPDIPFVVYIVLYLISDSVMTVVISHIWVNRHYLKLRYVLLLLCLLWIGYFLKLFEYIFADESLKVFFFRWQHVLHVLFPGAWIYFCYKFSRRGQFPVRAAVILLLFVSLIFMFLYLTNVKHQFMWSGIHVHVTGVHVVVQYNPGQYLFLLYALLCVLLGYRFLILKIKRAGSLLQRQTLRLIPFSLLPLLSGLIDFYLLNDIHYIRISPFFFAVSALVILYSAHTEYMADIPFSRNAVIESIDDICIILNPDNRIIYCNQALYTVFLLSPAGVIGKPLALIFRSLRDIVEDCNPRIAYRNEVVIAGRFYQASISPRFDCRGKVVNRILVMRDMTPHKRTEECLRRMSERLEELVVERTSDLEEINRVLMSKITEEKKTSEKLNSSLHEKKWLLGVNRDRIINNFQVIINLLKLQQRNLRDPGSRESFKTAIARIRIFAMVYGIFSESEDPVHANLKECAGELALYLLECHRPGGLVIKVVLAGDDMFLDLEQCLLCGLILNELVTNAIKYAFPPRLILTEERTIRLFFTVSGTKYVFGVQDNGIGLEEKRATVKRPGPGLSIVANLVEQLAGELIVESGQGTVIQVEFPKPVPFLVKPSLEDGLD